MKMNSKKIDSVKIKMSFFYNENNNLYHKIVDCKQTLEINFEILKTTFISSGGNEKIINDSITNGKSLLNKYENITLNIIIIILYIFHVQY